MFENDRTETPSPTNSLGVKGVGEAGTIAATPTITAAVLDALRPLGVEEIDMPLTFEGVRAAAATLGSGVIMVFDDTVDMTAILLRIAAFFRDESCGQCVPCRVGTVRQQELLPLLSVPSLPPSMPSVAYLELSTAMRDASICGLGQTASAAIESALKLGLIEEHVRS